ncbi:MAG: right-handed parallel beta-helix repeat-containing protein [Desulfosporosinus sp.]|nr:right-handed parallel beta-helix repeat-containing protein [Desulfosporosinus sp.]
MKISTFIFTSLLLAIPCLADIIVVEDDGSGDYPTIQAAIDAANNWDIIEVQPGTYIGDGNRDIDFKGKSITVRSMDPNDPDIVATTIIDCEGAESTPHRGFHFYHDEDANSILAGLTITNSYTVNSSGAIRCFEASPTITHCDIIGNMTGPLVDGGAGIYCWRSGSMITNCRFINNVAKGEGVGGGFRGSYASPHATINNCVFIGNSAYRGGAIFNCEGTVNNCVIVNNKARYGGGIHSNDGAITNCFISGNSGEYTGGLDWCNGPISNCIISGNTATLWGGAGLGWCHTTISNCIIAGNSAAKWGGGIYDSSATLRNCVIFGNTAGESGGGICFRGDEQMTTMENCIIWNNEAALGAQIAITNSSNISISYCDVEGGELAVHDHNEFSLNWGIGNIDEDPDFVDPGYWDPNDTPGDPDDDFWVDGDYHLKSFGWRWDSQRKFWDYDEVTSRCIDAGNPGSLLNDEPLSIPDDPGNERGVNIRINMGVYGGTTEASMPPYDWTLLSDVSNDGISNLLDFAEVSQEWLTSGDSLPCDLSRNGTVGMDDVLLMTQDWLKQTSWAQP